MSYSVSEISNICDKLIKEVSKIVIGKEEMLKFVILGILTDGHILFEDYPGLAKTLTAKTFAKAIGCDFNRVQFTPDLLPADITGTYIYNQKTSEFRLNKGPVFTNILLADEINRAPPKTQAALLEVMQERQTTMEGETYSLDRPFLVIATQNPIEYEGTYPLPEAQIDRFIMKLNVGYPKKKEEEEILRRMKNVDLHDANISKVIFPEDILRIQKSIKEVFIDDAIGEYIVNIVHSTRSHPDVKVGVSPRGSIAIFKLAKANAAFLGRDYVIPDDIKEVVVQAIAHRLVLKPEVRIKGERPEEIVKKIVKNIAVPITR